MSETLILDGTDETGQVRVTAYTTRVLTPETRRAVIAEMVKELHLTPNYSETVIEAP